MGLWETAWRGETIPRIDSRREVAKKVKDEVIEIPPYTYPQA